MINLGGLFAPYHKPFLNLNFFLTMKNLLFLSYLAFTVLLFSCKKDRETVRSTQNHLIGTWVIVELHVNEDPQPYEEIRKFRLVLSNDNSFRMTQFDGSEDSGSWSLASNDRDLELVGAVDYYSFSIIHLDESNLRMTNRNTSDKTVKVDYLYFLEKKN
jgi:hypothetical protein